MTNRKSTSGFPTNYRWSAYATPSPPMGGSESDFCVFNNMQL